MSDQIVYLLYVVILLQLVGTVLSFFVRDWFARVQRDIDAIEDRCAERLKDCPVARVQTRLEILSDEVKSLDQDIKELRQELDRLYEKVIG